MLFLFLEDLCIHLLISQILLDKAEVADHSNMSLAAQQRILFFLTPPQTKKKNSIDVILFCEDFSDL